MIRLDPLLFSDTSSTNPGLRLWLLALHPGSQLALWNLPIQQWHAQSIVLHSGAVSGLQVGTRCSHAEEPSQVRHLS